MPTTKNASASHETEDNSSGWLFAGHPSASPEIVAQSFSKITRVCQIADNPQEISELFKDVDAVALIINAKSGVSQSMMDFWSYLSERQFPRLIIVTGLEFSENDFDDIVLIANRVLEQTITPLLVLHDEFGEPTGLISLPDLQIHDYSSGLLRQYAADDELTALIADFRTEYLEQVEEFQDTGFESGLLVPALPFVAEKNIGKSEIQSYLNRIS